MTNRFPKYRTHNEVRRFFGVIDLAMGWERRHLAWRAHRWTNRPTGSSSSGNWAS